MSPKPFSPERLVDHVHTRNREFRAMLEQLQRVAPLETPVLLQGESGVGKDYIAEALHRCSPRSNAPFIRVECSSIPADLFESELFGFEKGAFTDAYETKMGRMELAQGGTIYLDNIGNLPLQLQSKLLRVIEEKAFTRLGSHRSIHVDVRFILSSIRDLAEMVNEGAFRQDLYYRINTLSFTLPPLRDRRDDISYLASIFVQEIAAEYTKKIRGLTQDSHTLLLLHAWHGNIRELRNVLERSVIVCNEERIFPHNLPLDAFTEEDILDEALRHKWPIARLEEVYIRKVLNVTHFNHTHAAKILGISRKTLIEKRKKYRIES